MTPSDKEAATKYATYKFTNIFASSPDNIVFAYSVNDAKFNGFLAGVAFKEQDHAQYTAYKALRAELERVKSEYADACKWAMDYENQVVELKSELSQVIAIGVEGQREINRKLSEELAQAKDRNEFLEFSLARANAEVRNGDNVRAELELTKRKLAKARELYAQAKGMSILGIETLTSYDRELEECEMTTPRKPISCQNGNILESNTPRVYTAWDITYSSAIGNKDFILLSDHKEVVLRLEAEVKTAQNCYDRMYEDGEAEIARLQGENSKLRELLSRDILEGEEDPEYLNGLTLKEDDFMGVEASAALLKELIKDGE